MVSGWSKQIGKEANKQINIHIYNAVSLVNVVSLRLFSISVNMQPNSPPQQER